MECSKFCLQIIFIMAIVRRYDFILYISCIFSISINTHRAIYSIQSKKFYVLVYKYITGYFFHSSGITACNLSIPIYISLIHLLCLFDLSHFLLIILQADLTWFLGVFYPIYIILYFMHLQVIIMTIEILFTFY